MRRPPCRLALLLLAVTSFSATAAAAVPPFAQARDQVQVAAHLVRSPVRQLSELPTGGRRIFPHHVLVAYYGTAHNSLLGVLGESAPRVMTRRLRAAARPFATSTREVQIVYELIVSIADAGPGADGDYSHFISRRYVRQYMRAARRHKALLVLDLQPGRSSFVAQARHIRWALSKPFVGLALDPEWRMGPHEVPAQTIGSVRASEVNRVSRLVAHVTRHDDLPQKLFMIHQFRTDMVKHIGRVILHKRLAMVQHVDGFGTQRAKLATFHKVVRPKRFHLGLKLFYDEDTDLFSPPEVRRIRPRIDFVSYQ